MIRFQRQIGMTVASALLLLFATPGFSQQPAQSSLADVRNMRRALLIVFRSGVLAVNNRDRSIIEEVLKADPDPRGRNLWVYSQLAKKLNAYIRKYRSITPAYDLSDADYVIYFNVIEYRRILNTTYPYGELFVIVKGSPESQIPPRIVWKGKKILWAGDAISDFIKELKTLRGET